MAAEAGWVPTAKFMAGPKVPSPIPKRMEILLLSSLHATKSNLSSPLKSPTSAEAALNPTANFLARLKKADGISLAASGANSRHTMRSEKKKVTVAGFDSLSIMLGSLITQPLYQGETIHRSVPHILGSMVKRWITKENSKGAPKKGSLETRQTV